MLRLSLLIKGTESPLPKRWHLNQSRSALHGVSFG